MIKLLDILNEIGDTLVEPYSLSSPKKGEYNDGTPTTEYNFTTDNGTKYVVIIKEESKNKIEISFNVVNDDTDDPYVTVTNEGDIRRIMSTIIKASKDYLNKHPKITDIIMTPSKSNEKDDRRLKLYMAYIKGQFSSGWDTKIKTGGYVPEIHMKKNK